MIDLEAISPEGHRVELGSFYWPETAALRLHELRKEQGDEWTVIRARAEHALLPVKLAA